MKNGFVKAAAVSPVIRLADTSYNAERVIEAIRCAEAGGVRVLVFPELTLTGVSCRDLFTHRVLLEGAEKALLKVAEATRGTDMLVFVGLPLAHGARVFSVGAALYDGEILGLVPNEAPSDPRFSAPESGEACEVELDGYGLVTLSSDLLFCHGALRDLRVAVEVGAGLDRFLSPAARHAEAGATVIAQMAAFPETVCSRDEAELNARYESRQFRCGMLLAAPGRGESTTDRAWSGLCLIAEDGKLLAAEEGIADLTEAVKSRTSEEAAQAADSAAEAAEDGTVIVLSEIDVEHMTTLRRATGCFDLSSDYMAVSWGDRLSETALSRRYLMHPHLPETAEELPGCCRRMLDIQVSGLVRRMEYAGLDHCVVGISGGVDSTLAVMVSAMAVRRMGLPASNVVACTLPCFGTSSRTKSNAIVVAEQLGAEVRVIDIGKAVYQHFDDIGHAHDDYSIAYENAQARERTQVLMDIANKCNGLDVGTEDLSEFIDGWCTYNGDHTSMYDVNMGLTKTQVRANVRYVADTTEDRVLKAALYDVLECPVTPELLPIHDDQIEQKSEEAVGSYSLQDFFTHKMLICGFTPSKTFRLAKLAYAGEFTDEELVRWLTSYCRRLFSQQFKRSCLMDGPAVETFSVSPRDGFLIPSDAESTLFLQDLESVTV
ncbi:MAG: NAD(+) synthase [Oscillospiraceae bacterium]|nr:NAD(+) synthase [Oscillospiraceae bacterium]